MVDAPDHASGSGAPFQQLDRCAAYPHTAGTYARRAAWRCVQAVLLRPSPARAYGWRRFWLRRFGAQLDANASTRPGATILHPWHLTLGAHAMLADGVCVYNLGPVSVGAHTVISQGTYLCAGTHDYTDPTLPLQMPAIHIGAGVWIGAQAFIGPGVTVGDNSVIGARSVVMKDVPVGVVVAGNPARVLKNRPMRAT